MNFVIASDIHGSATYCKKLVEILEKEQADKLLLLGDILYHGPRNPLPDGYNPAEVATLLNAIKDKILCVRGNCDSEVDRLVLDFNILSDYALVYADGLNICLSHGHRDVPPLMNDEIYLTGHTHVPLKERCGYIHLNPGSVSLPKDGSPHSYILYKDRTFYFKDLNGRVYDEIAL